MGTSAQAIGWPDELVARLVHSGRQVLRFDHRDTGLSDCVDFTANPYTLADMTADTLAVLDGHGIDRAHVVGVSLGGAIGQWLAVHHGARVQTLITIMTPHDLAGRRFTAERLAPLSSITSPTLVIHGSEDPIFATAHAEALAAQVPGARLRIIEGMGSG